MKKLLYLLPMTLGCGMLPAQSKAPVTHEVRYLTPEEAGISPDAEPASTPLILNEFVIMGTNVTGLPCYNCVTGANAPNLGVVTPIGLVSTNVQYGVDAFLVDQNYTGTCNFTFAVTRKTTTIYSAGPYAFSETAPTTILLGTAITIPTGTAKGVASLSMTAVCGSSTTRSASAIYITN